MNDRVRLSTLLGQRADADPPVEPIVPFAAMFGDAVKIVVAVLDRTAVLSEPSDRYDRRGVRHDQVLVDPAVITWRSRTSNYEGNRILNAGMKPGSDEAKGSMHLLRHPRKQAGSHWRRSRPINPGNVAGAEARQASDERALQNQREVEATKHRELAAHRQRQPKRIEEEVMSIVIAEQRAADTTSTAPIGAGKPEKTKRCVACGNDKPAAAFPVGPRGPQRCLDCRAKSGSALTLTSVATPATSEPTNGAHAEVEKKARKPRMKKGRATGKARRGKKIEVGETALLVAHGPHDKVVKLLERRNALRTQLAEVQAQLQEAIG